MLRMERNEHSDDAQDRASFCAHQIAHLNGFSARKSGKLCIFGLGDVEESRKKRCSPGLETLKDHLCGHTIELLPEISEARSMPRVGNSREIPYAVVGRTNKVTITLFV